MGIRLYNTARRAVVPFEPGPVVHIYVCGVTPYDSTHLGHAATFLTYDVLIRRLEDLGHEVHMVRNFTDIDDPLFERARATGVDALELAEEEIARFRSDMAALDTRPPLAEPRVTESIPAITAMIESLLESGHAYTVDGTTYFDTERFAAYGSLSGLATTEMIELARERGGTPDDERQRNPLDFVLWKPADSAGEPSWNTSFGPGRPGWHIECSAMNLAAFGETIDLHGGGDDLIFPHHESEIAQSESASGVPFARHWLHCGMVAYDGEKMSKSLGNLVFVSELLKEVDARAIRLAALSHHYRAGFDWSDAGLAAAEGQLNRLVLAAQRHTGPDSGPTLEAVRAALDNDLDTPAALGALLDHANATGDDPVSGAGLVRAANLLGIDLTHD